MHVLAATFVSNEPDNNYRTDFCKYRTFYQRINQITSDNKNFGLISKAKEIIKGSCETKLPYREQRQLQFSSFISSKAL